MMQPCTRRPETTFELSRDIANKFNLDFISQFIAPEPLIQKNLREL